jgi:hypothetical protein
MSLASWTQVKSNAKSWATVPVPEDPPDNRLPGGESSKRIGSTHMESKRKKVEQRISTIELPGSQSGANLEVR